MERNESAGMVSGVVARRIRCRVLWSDLVTSVE